MAGRTYAHGLCERYVHIPLKASANHIGTSTGADAKVQETEVVKVPDIQKLQIHTWALGRNSPHKPLSPVAGFRLKHTPVPELSDRLPYTAGVRMCKQVTSLNTGSLSCVSQVAA